MSERILKRKSVYIGTNKFNNLHHAYACAKHDGYNGDEQLFRSRYRRGIRDWNELIRKVKPYEKKNYLERSENAKRGAMKKWNEMADIILELDRRKMELMEKS